MVCRFKFAKELFGFKATSNEETGLMETLEAQPLTVEEIAKKCLSEIEREILDPTVHGSGYHKKDGLTLLRNHPRLVGHIYELLIIWGGNTDQKTIESYDQLLNYILKYVMKPEKASEF